MSLGFIHAIACDMISFLFQGWIIIFHCMYTPHLFIHSSVDGWFGCFYLLAVMNNAVLNRGIQKTLLSILWHKYPEVELLDYVVITFWGFLRNLLSFLTVHMCKTMFMLLITVRKCLCSDKDPRMPKAKSYKVKRIMWLLQDSSSEI